MVTLHVRDHDTVPCAFDTLVCLLVGLHHSSVGRRSVVWQALDLDPSRGRYMLHSNMSAAHLQAGDKQAALQHAQLAVQHAPMGFHMVRCWQLAAACAVVTHSLPISCQCPTVISGYMCLEPFDLVMSAHVFVTSATSTASIPTCRCYCCS